LIYSLVLLIYIWLRGNHKGYNKETNLFTNHTVLRIAPERNTSTGSDDRNLIVDIRAQDALRHQYEMSPEILNTPDRQNPTINSIWMISDYAGKDGWMQKISSQLN